MRTSPVHYIAPSAISITPNANNSHRDLAVYVGRDTKIKVRCPRAGIGTDENGSYQEWVLSGRNRRLADKIGTTPYTIYARLNKSGAKTGYLVFAKKILRGSDWIDAYSHLTLDEKQTDGYSVLYTDNGFEIKKKSPDYYYVYLGYVSASENGQRTVTLDTGILGTDQYNNEFVQNPDMLPLRINLGCTVNDEDVGLNPYVYWGQSLELTATLTEGWANTNIQRFHHWSISRKSDSEPLEDRHWLDGDERETTFGTSGEISLRHLRNSDDFNGAVATTFTIMAMEVNPDYTDGSELDPYLILKSATITILAETIEKYDLTLSSNIVGYNPQTGNYTPDTNVIVGIRATNQRGDVFDLTKSEVGTLALSVKYAPVGVNQETNVEFPGASDTTANGTIPISTAFALQKSVNVRLVRTIVIATDEVNEDPQTEEIELARTTIAFVRDGEDSKEREWIYTRRTTATTFSGNTGANALPSLITLGEISPNGISSGNVTYDNTTDEWVPNGWTDNPQGTAADIPYEYGAYRNYIREYDENNSEGGHWGPFSEPKIYNHYGNDGTKTQRRYRSTNTPTYTENIDNSSDHPVGWSEVGIPTQITVLERYRWMIERTSDDGGATWGLWSAPVIEAYMAKDGTSIAIKGHAKGVIEWGGSLPPSRGSTNLDTWLHNDNTPDDMDIYFEDMSNPSSGLGQWEGYSVDIGDCYLINGYLWSKVRNEATESFPRWGNIGRLQGLDGKNAIVIDLDNESEVMLYDGSGLRVSQIATSQAILLNGNTPVNSGVTWSISNATGVTLKNNGNATSETYSGNTDCWISDSGLVTVRGLAASDAEITVRANYNNNYYYTKFTLHKQIGTDRYELVVSPNAIPYNFTTQQPYQVPVTVSLYKTTINGTHAMSAPPTDYTICAFYGDDVTPFLTARTSSTTFSVFPIATDANHIRIVLCQLSNNRLVTGTILDSETILIARTENGENGEDAHEVQPNILLRTIFDKGIDFVKEKWTSNWDAVYVDRYSGTVVQGRKSIRIDAMSAGEDLEFYQDVLGKIKPETYYTLSFNVFHTAGGNLIVSFYNFIGGSRVKMIDGNPIVDGVETVAAENNDIVIPAGWDGKRHVVTFKTRSTQYISNSELKLVFWQSYYDSGDANHSISCICMPKLEEGNVATAYLPHEDDLIGKTGDTGHTGRFYYFSGEYNPANIYRIDASQAPYVKFSGPDDNNNIQTGFFMLDYKGGEPPYVNWPDDGHPAAPTFKTGNGIPWTPWTQMSSEHQYYIARAFFGENAYFGSFIINGDWLISQYGTYKPNANTKIIVDATNFAQYSTAFTHFKSEDPLATGSANAQSTYPCFAPNFAVDGKTGKTYQKNAYVEGELHAHSGDFQNVKISGGMRSPFTYITPSSTFSSESSDNLAIYSVASTDENDNTLPTTYDIPWDASQSGRKLVIVNYRWNYETQTGYAKLNAPNGKYFYEDGILKTSIQLSREVVELIGYGSQSEFYGWIVLTRTDIGTTGKYGHQLKALAVGKVIVNNGFINRESTGVETFDGSGMTVQRLGTGKYKIAFENASWSANPDLLHVTATGYGNTVNGPLYASIHSIDNTGFEIWTGDDSTLNDGSFTFIVMNLSGWQYLNS